MKRKIILEEKTFLNLDCSSFIQGPSNEVNVPARIDPKIPRGPKFGDCYGVMA
jgi:hypothetical protein